MAAPNSSSVKSSGSAPSSSSMKIMVSCISESRLTLPLRSGRESSSSKLPTSLVSFGVVGDAGQSALPRHGVLPRSCPSSGCAGSSTRFASTLGRLLLSSFWSQPRLTIRPAIQSVEHEDVATGGLAVGELVADDAEELVVVVDVGDVVDLDAASLLERLEGRVDRDLLAALLDLLLVDVERPVGEVQRLLGSADWSVLTHDSAVCLAAGVPHADSSAGAPTAEPGEPGAAQEAAPARPARAGMQLPERPGISSGLRSGCGIGDGPLVVGVPRKSVDSVRASASEQGIQWRRKHVRNEILRPAPPILFDAPRAPCDHRPVTQPSTAARSGNGRTAGHLARVVLDDVSKAIIEELQQDGRRSYAAIGKVVGLSEAAVRQRVQRLVDAASCRSSRSPTRSSWASPARR